MEWSLPHGLKEKPLSVVDNTKVFKQLLHLRNSHHDSDDVVYHNQSGIGVSLGLTHASGVLLWAPPELETNITLKVHVPMLLLAAITSHTAARLRETRVDRGKSRTSNLILLLSVFTTGLAVLVAVFIMSKQISDVERRRSEEFCRDNDVETVIAGDSGWDSNDKVSLIVSIAAVTILAAPIALAVVDGTLDPRKMYEVTSGASVMYSSAYPGLSKDPKNYMAGSIFVVTSWITVRELDNGFATSLACSTAVIVLWCISIVMQTSKQCSEIMSAARSTGGGFSLRMLFGYLCQWAKAKREKNVVEFLVFVRFADMRNSSVELNLMCAKEWRCRSNEAYWNEGLREKDKMHREAAGQAAESFLQEEHNCRSIGLFAKIRLDDYLRFKLANARTKPWGKAMPREFYRIKLGCKSSNWIEFYKANGVFPPDEMIILVALGCLQYGRDIAEVRWKEIDRLVSMRSNVGQQLYDTDGVKCWLVVPKSDEVIRMVQFWEEKDKASRCSRNLVPTIRDVDGHRGQFEMFENNCFPWSSEEEKKPVVKWEDSERGNAYRHVPKGGVELRYLLANKALVKDLSGRIEDIVD